MVKAQLKHRPLIGNASSLTGRTASLVVLIATFMPAGCRSGLSLKLKTSAHFDAAIQIEKKYKK